MSDAAAADAVLDAVDDQFLVDRRGRTDADDFGIDCVEHLLVVREHAAVRNTVVIRERRGVLADDVGAGDDLGVGDGRVGVGVAVGHREARPVRVVRLCTRTDDGDCCHTLLCVTPALNHCGR